MQNIAGDNLGSFDFEETAVTKDDRLKGKSLFQLIHDGTSLEFLDEADGSVKEKQGADDAEIDPILETGGENSGSLVRIRCISRSTLQVKDKSRLLSWWVAVGWKGGYDLPP